jgi:hypothetical protein
MRVSPGLDKELSSGLSGGAADGETARCSTGVPARVTQWELTSFPDDAEEPNNEERAE